MRILQLCSKPPFPTVDGGTVAANELTQGLIKAGHTVKVLTIETAKHPFKKDKLTAEYIEKTSIESVFLDTEITVSGLLKAFFSRDLYIVKRFDSETFKQKLIDVLKLNNYDVVLLEGLYLAPYIDAIKQHSPAKIILRAHNVEFLIWQRMLDDTNGALRRFYLKRMVNQLQKYEIESLNKVHGIATISSVDEKSIQRLVPTKKVINLPLTTQVVNTGAEVVSGSVFHLGSMDWGPNVQGISWFIGMVWPGIIAQKPEAKLYLAGRNMPESIKKKATENIKVDGEVDDAINYISSKQIMVVPLFAGSGVRVKIIEGMALGKAIVATTLAVEGLDITNGENIILADKPGDFAAAVVGLLNNKAAIDKLSQNAIAFIDANHRPQVVIQKFEKFAGTL